MNDDRDKRRSDAEAEEEIRRSRKFNPTEAFARMAGPGAMKGASPVSPVQQAEAEIGTWLRNNVPDAAGVLPALMHRHVRGSDLLLNALDRPLAALAGYCQRILDSDYLLKELVREADVEWGQRMDERPHFEREGTPQHPDDPYTAQSVRKTLEDALKLLPPGNQSLDD